MTDDVGSARTATERKRAQWAERQPRQRIRDALALTNDRGLSESKAPGVLDRTGSSLCNGIRFLKGGCHFEGIKRGRSTVKKTNAKAQLAPTAASQRMREHRARKAIGATRIAIDLDGDDKDWLRSQGVLREWDEEDERALAQALKLALQKQRRKVTA